MATCPSCGHIQRPRPDNTNPRLCCTRCHLWFERPGQTIEILGPIVRDTPSTCQQCGRERSDLRACYIDDEAAFICAECLMDLLEEGVLHGGEGRLPGRMGRGPVFSARGITMNDETTSADARIKALIREKTTFPFHFTPATVSFPETDGSRTTIEMKGAHVITEIGSTSVLLVIHAGYPGVTFTTQPPKE